MSGPAQLTPCPTCGMAVQFRADGTPGRHWTSAARERTRCPAGERAQAPPRTGRRVRVCIDVVIPADASTGKYRDEAAALLRGHATALLVVNVDVTDGGAS